MKAPDDTCIPLCARHHFNLHNRLYAFSGYPKETIRRWQDERISETQRLVQGQKAKEG